LAALEPRPTGYAFALKVREETLHIERPVTRGVADVNSISRVDCRHHGVTHRAPDGLVGEVRKIFHVDRNTVVLHQCGHSGEFAVVQRDADVNHGFISSNMRGSSRHRASTSLWQYSKICRCSSGVKGQP